MGRCCEEAEPVEVLMRKYHLFRNFGVYKSTIRRNFEDNDRGPEYDPVKELLAKRTQSYTLPEIRLLFGFLWTAHDECVLANSDDYGSLQVWNARQKVQFGEETVRKLESLEAELGVVD
jgi:hypothetical protein